MTWCFRRPVDPPHPPPPPSSPLLTCWVLQAEKKAEAGDKAPAAAAAAKAASPTPGAAAAEEVRPWRGMCGQPCVRAAVVPQDTCLMGCARLAWHLVAVAATHPHTTHTPVHISLDTPHPAPSAAAPQAVPDDPYAFMPKPEDNNQVRGKRRGRGGGAEEEEEEGGGRCWMVERHACSTGSGRVLHTTLCLSGCSPFQQPYWRTRGTAVRALSCCTNHHRLAQPPCKARHGTSTQPGVVAACLAHDACMMPGTISECTRMCLLLMLLLMALSPSFSPHRSTPRSPSAMAA
jgi:hypothetical protein